MQWMNITPLTPKFASDWDAFVDAHPGGWWWHRTEWLTYQVAHAGARDASFGLIEGDRFRAVCPLLIQPDGRFAMEGYPLPWPLEEKGYYPEGRVWSALPRASISFRGSPLVEYVYPEEGTEGWRDISWPSRVLDLIKSEAELHAGVRKSYRHMINRGRQTWERYDCAGSPEAFHVLWGEINGRRRHPQAEALMSDWLKTGHARLLGAWRGGRWEAFCYAIVYKRRAYWASGPSLVLGAMHALQWEMILALKTEGVELYELGWQARPGDSDKDRGIARFKAGFGGEDRMVQAVERDFREEFHAH